MATESSKGSSRSRGSSKGGSGSGSSGRSGSGQSSGKGSGGSGGSQGAANKGGGVQRVCAFWLCGDCFALDIGLVGELVTVDQLAPVPLSKSAMLGLFNFRGTPLALIDLAEILEIPASKRSEITVGDGKPYPVLVIRASNLMAGVLIDRMEIVLEIGPGVLSRPKAGGDNPLVQGFLEADNRGGLFVTVLDTAALLQRLEQLKYQ
ncbi:MAG: chemotaxis protein CheW [Myxococcales bacterium]|nr:chemotaxis protein CheW [Myxococcales bacterium]